MNESQPTRIGVLSPLLAGSYSGIVLAGAVREAEAAGVGVVGIQTLDISQGGIRALVPDYALRTAWEQVAGFVVVVNAVGRDYLESLRAAGTPVVLVADELEGFPCPAVRADNRGGVTQAVAHLIEHGHRRIAFCGAMYQADIRERRAAYADALRAHGMEPAGELFFETGDNLESGGAAAARAFLAAGAPATAIVAATDFNAIGLMRALTEEGLEIPRDVAVAGFDDVTGSSAGRPTLSRVHHSVEAAGGRAARLLLDLIAGREVAMGPHLVPTTFIARESCGCSAGATAQALASPASACAPAEQNLRLRLERLLLGSDQPTAEQADHLDRAVALMVAGLAAEPAEGGGELSEAARRLFAVSPRWTTITAAIDCCRAYQRDGGGGATADPARLTDLAVELSRALAQHEQRAHSDLNHSVARQFQLTISLLGGGSGDPHSLGWLASSSARAACLGLWAAEPAGAPTAGRRLVIAGSYVRDGDPPLSLPAEAIAERFPPPALLDDVAATPGEITLVVPLRTEAMDMGLLAMVAPVESTQVTGRDAIFELDSLLSVAMERFALGVRLRHDALHDPLTGLPNRALLRDRIEQALARAQRRPGDRVALLHVDLDGFTHVNDTLGHAAGDRLLVALAQRVTDRLRDGDTAARLGGDEFALLLEEIHDPADAERVAGDLAARIAAPYEIDGRQVVVGAAIGVAVSGADRERPEQLLRNADLALHRAKASGPNGHALYEPRMFTALLARHELEAELRRAIAGGELRVRFQPIVEMATGRVRAAEALVRWEHPTRGTIAPLDFIPLAEETGAIHALERWVLRTALRSVAALRHRVPVAGAFTVSVNLSPHRLHDPELVTEIAAALRGAVLPPTVLTMEVTESALLSNTDTTVGTLKRIRGMGVRLAIDDFGAGYSSLTYLTLCDFDVLKIDRAFITGMVGRGEGTAITRAILAMAAILDLRVVAEGVENDLQAARLIEMGCTLAQGDLYSRPVDLERLARLLAHDGGGLPGAETREGSPPGGRMAS